MKAQTTVPREPLAPVQALTQDFGSQLASPNRELTSPAAAPAATSRVTDSAPGLRQRPGRDDAELSPEIDRSMTSDPALGQRIAERAYFLYLARHGEEGDALSDWLEAERQVSEEESIHG